MLKTRRRAHSILLERDELSLSLGNKEHISRTRGLGKRTTWKQGFEEDRHMYKKHGRDRETSLELQVKASCEGTGGARIVYGATDISDAAGRTGISWQPSESS